MLFADVAELADALDLGSSVTDVGVQVPSSAPIKAITSVIAFFIYFIQLIRHQNQPIYEIHKLNSIR